MTLYIIQIRNSVNYDPVYYTNFSVSFSGLLLINNTRKST
jgi:hypothetical protein